MRRSWIRLLAAGNSSKIDGLPFRLDRIAAAKRLLEHQHWMMNKGAKIIQKACTEHTLVTSPHDPIRARFMPFHSADIRGLTSSVVGQYGIDRTEIYWVWMSTGKNGHQILVPQTRIVTDWQEG
jgi:hypothetical protein